MQSIFGSLCVHRNGQRGQGKADFLGQDRLFLHLLTLHSAFSLAFSLSPACGPHPLPGHWYSHLKTPGHAVCLSVRPQVHYLQRPIALWCGLNHSLVLSQTSDFSKELLGCGCGAGGRLPGWPKGSASFVKLHIKVRAGSGERALRKGRAIEPGGPWDLTSLLSKVFKIYLGVGVLCHSVPVEGGRQPMTFSSFMP